ncbi:hypothetical protein GIB67_018119 [Kingdonia uniflora]|uniref:Uncharacterized protein n=1 Tax=Kingdonia uniflora TaxID=39325 RepID=A0A7J7NWL8_9MAGN|nr:hypothetical protein GIB67_018119 [Kingdonia uniflora]
MHELTPKILLVQQVISPTDNFPSQQTTSSSQREHEKHQHIDKECMLVGCPWRIVAHGVIVGVDSADMCHSVALGDDFYKVAIYDIVDALHSRFQARVKEEGKRLEIKQTSEGKESPGLVEAQVYSRDEVWETIVSKDFYPRDFGSYKDDQDVRSASDMVFWSEGLLHVSKLKCRVVGAYFEKTGSKAFTVYSIVVTNAENKTWFVKRSLKLCQL